MDPFGSGVDNLWVGIGFPAVSEDIFWMVSAFDLGLTARGCSVDFHANPDICIDPVAFIRLLQVLVVQAAECW